MFQGLSLDQAPPFSVPLRFFLTAPLMALLAGGFLLFGPTEQLTTRWSPMWLSVTHLLVLGLMANVMMGALFQMLPVVIGAPMARAQLWGSWIHGLWLGGVLALVNGFRWSEPVLLSLGGLLLGVAALIFVTLALECFLRSRSAYATATAMRWAVISLAITVALGLLLLGGHLGWWSLWRPLGTRLHLMWGLWGWVFLLILGVSYQVIPMFYVTDPFPEWLKAYWGTGLVALMGLWSLVTWMEIQIGRVLFVEVAATLVSAALTIGTLLYAGVTLRRIRTRKRKIKDPTLRFWYLALVCSGVGALGQFILGLDWVGSESSGAFELSLGVLMIWGGAVAVIQAMLFKIVPFLVWFHLHALSTATPALMGKKVPHMKQVLGDPVVRRQWGFHGLSLGVLVLSPWFHESLYHLGGALMMGQALHLLWHLTIAARLQIKTRSQWEIEASQTPS